MTKQWDIESVARELIACEDEQRDRGPFTDDWAGLDIETAYRIQDRTLELRLERGETLLGVKLGLTSRAKQVRMGVDTPFVAWLTDAMVLEGGEPLDHGRLIHPRAEPELVFHMAEDLSGPTTAFQAMQAVGTVAAGVEIIDSRYADFKFTAPDVIADNASSAAYLTGPISRPALGMDLSTEAVLVEVDGEVVDSATGAAIQGHPGEALALAANSLHARGLSIRKGWIVLTGGMTDAVPVRQGGSIAMRFSSLGTVHLHG